MPLPPPIYELREMVLHGEYDQVLARPDLLSSVDEQFKDADLDDLDKWQLSTLLAELYDQTSHYETAALLIAFDPGGTRALDKLKKRAESMAVALKEFNAAKSDHKRRDKVQPLPSPSKEAERRFRSIARFGLAHAISLHRRTGDKGVSLNKATRLGQTIFDQLRTLELAGYHFEGTQSFVAYWLGRFYMLGNDLDNGEKFFNKAIHYQHLNLGCHFAEHNQGLGSHVAGERRSCATCQRRVAISSYHLASITAFGLGIINLRLGKLSESLTQFRSAGVLLEGCSNDRYREGYSQLLAGTAHRLLIGPYGDRLEPAFTHLKEARALFGEGSGDSATHRYYAARAIFQLSTTHLYAARDHRQALPRRFRSLVFACAEYCSLQPEVLQSEAEDLYADLDLQARAHILNSRILIEVLKVLTEAQSRNETAAAYAFLGQISQIDNVYRLSAALVVRGEASLEIGLFRRLAQHADEHLRIASETDLKMRGDDSHRPSLVLCAAALAAALLTFVNHSKFTYLEEIDQDKLQQLKTYCNSLVKRANDELLALLHTSATRTPRIQAAAHIGLARLSLARNEVPALRKHLRLANHALLQGVEHALLRDEASELERMIPEPPDEVTVSVRIDGRDLSKEEIEADFHARLAKWAYDNQMTQQEAADHFGVTTKTIGTWGKPLQIAWRGR
jgi:hypothetical protein